MKIIRSLQLDETKSDIGSDSEPNDEHTEVPRAVLDGVLVVPVLRYLCLRVGQTAGAPDLGVGAQHQTSVLVQGHPHEPIL